MYYLISFFHGFLNTVNRLTNVQAGKSLGTMNGALVNYIEATFLSLFLIFVTGKQAELAPSHLANVPLWVYGGAVAGLIAQLLQIVGTLKTNALISSILCLVGNLLMAVVLDYVFFAIFSPIKITGIALILIGTVLVQRNGGKKV